MDDELERATTGLNHEVDEMTWGPNAEDNYGTHGSFDKEQARTSHVVVTLDELIPLGSLDEWKRLRS